MAAGGDKNFTPAAFGPPIDTIYHGGNSMKATQLLHDLGQSLWLDNITRDLLDNGTLQRYIDELSVTGLIRAPSWRRPVRPGK
jgi:hypothetical protein